jgi:YbgC/YbaW family acyl-CoA thioester hydrolase
MSGRPCSRITQTVAMVDVDAVQINFAAYFRWMDYGYMDLLRKLGRPLSTLLTNGVSTPAVDARCSYLRPVNLDDTVGLTTYVSSVGHSSYIIEHRFEHAGEPIATGRITHVWISTTTSPHTATAAPDWLRAAAEGDLPA